MTTKKEKISGGVPKNPVMKYLYLNKGILAGALGIFLVFGFLTEFKFWGRANVINILRITSLDSIAAFGVTLIIITGGIDLSVGALMACASTYCALLISNGLHPAGALLVGVLIATVFGAINGGIVANTKIPPFIVTLGTMNIGRGIAYTCSAGTPIRISGDFGEIGNGYLMNTIPYPIIYTAVILAITYVLLNKTKFGREVYAIGGNAQSALMMGLNVRKTKFKAYMLDGFLAGCGGFLFCLNSCSGFVEQAKGLEMDAISASVIGGTLLSGGVGTPFGTVFGVLIKGTISSLITTQGTLSSWWVRIVLSALLCFFIVLQSVFAGIKKKK